MGAYFTIVTSPCGISPISRKCCRSAPSPPTDLIVAVFPIGNSRNVMFSLISAHAFYTLFPVRLTFDCQSCKNADSLVLIISYFHSLILQINCSFIYFRKDSAFHQELAEVSKVNKRQIPLCFAEFDASHFRFSSNLFLLPFYQFANEVAYRCNNHTVDRSDAPRNQICNSRADEDACDCEPVDLSGNHIPFFVFFFMAEIAEYNNHANRRQCAV